MNLLDLFAIPRRRTPDKTALRFREPSEVETVLTYDRLFSQADSLAAGLAASGLGKGDRVAFFLGNRPEFVVAYLAVIRLGAVMVPVNLRYRRLEIGHIFSDCAPRLVVTEKAEAPYLEDAGYASNGEVPWLLVEELRAWES